MQENQKYLSQLTSLMQEAADEQTKSIVVSLPIKIFFLYSREMYKQDAGINLNKLQP